MAAPVKAYMRKKAVGVKVRGDWLSAVPHSLTANMCNNNQSPIITFPNISTGRICESVSFKESCLLRI